MSDKFIALITARGGSKGLPRKNVLPLGGLPLIGWSIKAAKECKLISEVFVSTDDDEIATVSESFGAKIIERPKELATDTASSVDVILHSAEWLVRNGYNCDNMVLLQPTSPLRTGIHIQEALNVFFEKKADLVISVFEPHHTPVKAYIASENGSIKGLYSANAPYCRRQDLPPAYQPNGAIYAFSAKKFKVESHFPRENVFPYIMQEVDSADIDTIDDVITVEKRMKEINR